MRNLSIWACFFLLIPSSMGQACLPACSANLTTCGAISYNLFITNTTDVLGAEKIVQKFQYEGLQMLNFIKYFPDTLPCYYYLSAFLCNAHHPSCEPNNTIPTPIPMCYDQCIVLNATCGSIFKYLPEEIQEFFDCGAVGPLGPLYTLSPTCSRAPPLNYTTPPGTGTAGCPNNTLLAPITTFYTGVCAKFNATAAPHLYEFCGPFLSENIYVAMNWTMIQQWQDDFCIPYLSTVTDFYPVSPQKCHKHITALACRSIMPSCSPRYVPFYNIYSGVPTISCDSFCDLANENCQEFYEGTNSSSYYVQNCSVYPSGNYTLFLSPFDVLSVPCGFSLYPDNAIEPYTIPNTTCPAETGKKIIRSDNDSYCDLRCPDASYSLAEWKKLSQLTIVGACLSLIAMVFLILSYLLQYERRKFPSSIHFWEFVATALFAVSFLIGGNEPEKTTWCYDAGTNATQENNTRCGVQGFFFIFFGIALTAWCCVIAFLMFYAIVFNKKLKNMQHYSVLMHLFAWGVSLAFSVAAVATKSIGYGPPLAWCFIHFDGFGFSSGGISKDYVFFYIPIAVLFFSILFMFLCTVAKIIHVRSQSIENTSVATKGSQTFRAQIRVLIFIFIIFVICFTIFEWRLQIQGSKTLAAVGLNWTYCKIKGHLGIPTTAICDGDTNPARVDYRHTAFESFLLSGIGILIFIGFGSDPSIYRHWYNIFKLIGARNWKALHQFVKYGKFGKDTALKSGEGPYSGTFNSLDSGDHENNIAMQHIVSGNN